MPDRDDYEEGNQSDLDREIEQAHSNDAVLGFRYLPTRDGEEPMYVPQYVKLAHEGFAANIRIYEPATGEQVSGLIFRGDEWERLLDRHERLLDD